MSGLQLVTAVAGLDVGARALLDLWLRQGVEDVEIAAVLGARPGDVAERRAQVLHRLMFETGAAPGGGREALVSKLRSIFAEGGPALVYGRLSEGAADDARERVSTALAETADQARAEAPGEPTDEGEEAARTTHIPDGSAADSDRTAETEPSGATEHAGTEPAPTASAASTGAATPAIADPPAQPGSDDETAQPSSGRPRSRIAAERRLVIVAAAAVLAIGAVLAGVLLGDRPDAPAPPGASPAPPPADDLAWVELNPMPAAVPSVEGMAALTGEEPQRRLEVRTSGLPEPPSRYRVWLSNPPGLTPVGRLRFSDGTLSAPLQADPSDFRFVFVLLDEKWGGPRGTLAVRTEELLSAQPARGSEPAPAP